MAEQLVAKNKARMILWALAAILAVASLVIFFLNYRTLEQTTISAEKNAVAEARNFRYYVNEFKVTKVALDDANQKIVDLTRELEAANMVLTQTRDELASVQQLNDQFKASIATLEHYKVNAAKKGEALEGMISSFKKKNRELDHELQGVRKELAEFQPNINDVDEGRIKIKRFKDHIIMVKQNMSLLREKADEARVAAQQERDRLESLYGNGGFLVKNGQNKSTTGFDQKRIEINVKFINK